jgi:Ca-activated chloride channel homolog
MVNIVFYNPVFLYFLAIIPLLVAWYIFGMRRSKPFLLIPGLQPFKNSGRPVRLYLRHFGFALKMLGLALLFIALARPQSVDEWSVSNTEGVDIVLCIDISGSMRAVDFKPDRLEASKKVAADFINSRPADRFAITLFSSESFTQCPLTNDKATLINLLNQVTFGMIEDGTAIGTGLATAINRLKESKALSKVIILLTDGVNNTGMIGPLTAAEIAAEYGIRVYTIGVGTEGYAPFPVQTPFGTQYRDMLVEIDEDVLQQIANLTGGKYYRAKDEKMLAAVYQEIDQLEKTILDVEKFSKRKEEYFPFLFLAILLLAIDSLLGLTVIRTLP